MASIYLKSLAAEILRRKQSTPAVVAAPPPPPPPPRSEERKKRLENQKEAIITATVKAIYDRRTPESIRKKYFDKLKDMGIPEDNVHERWYALGIASHQGPGKETTLADLGGGRRRRRRQTRRKTVKRRRTMRRKSRGGGSGGV